MNKSYLQSFIRITHDTNEGAENKIDKQRHKDVEIQLAEDPDGDIAWGHGWKCWVHVVTIDQWVKTFGCRQKGTELNRINKWEWSVNNVVATLKQPYTRCYYHSYTRLQKRIKPFTQQAHKVVLTLIQSCLDDNDIVCLMGKFEMQNTEKDTRWTGMKPNRMNPLSAEIFTVSGLIY